jgi:transposase
MPRKAINMRKIREVLRLDHSQSANIREIASSCGIAASTVHEYLRRAEAASVKWPLPPEMSDEELESRLFAPVRLTSARILPDWSHIQRELCRKGVTLDLLWREYRERNPDGYGRSQFNHLYRRWAKTTDVRMLQRHVAGERMWVDWSGMTGRLVDPLTGEVSEAQIFVAAFGVSQKLFSKGFPSQELEHWLEAQACALDFYGAVPQISVPDNTKTGVNSPHRYEPELNLEYAEFAHHYGIAVIPARIYKPRDKAKVENGVLQVERHVLAPVRDRTFFSLRELNEELERLTAAFNSRLMRGPNASRNELFEELDRPAAKPLPETRYRYAQWKKAKVAPDYHVEFEGHKYSVPYTLVGKTALMRIAWDTVQILESGKAVATHLRSYVRMGFTTDPSHMPRSHREHAEWTPPRLIRWASESGESVGRFVEAMLESKVHPEQGFRAAMGLIGLGKRYGALRLDRACARALEARALSYRSVKSILEKGLDQVVDPEVQPPLLPVHDNVRGADYYKGDPGCAN